MGLMGQTSQERKNGTYALSLPPLPLVFLHELGKSLGHRSPPADEGRALVEVADQGTAQQSHEKGPGQGSKPIEKSLIGDCPRPCLPGGPADTCFGEGHGQRRTQGHKEQTYCDGTKLCPKPTETQEESALIRFSLVRLTAQIAKAS